MSKNLHVELSSFIFLLLFSKYFTFIMFTTANADTKK